MEGNSRLFKIDFVINGTLHTIDNIDEKLFMQLTSKLSIHTSIIMNGTTSKSFIADDEYAVQYINTLIEHKVIDEQSLYQLQRFENGRNADLLNDKVEAPQAGNSRTKSTDGEWSEGETKLLLDKYEAYLPQIGSMKKFKNKKAMWEQISKDIETILTSTKSSVQCENRFKTILKRKKKSVDNNNTSGSSRVKIAYEEELNKIAAIDDCVEPEIMMGVNRCKRKGSSDSSTHSENVERNVRAKHETNRGNKSTEALLTFLKEKEEAKERRHRERIDTFKELIAILKKD